MASTNVIRSILGLTGVNAILTGTILYQTNQANQKIDRNLEEFESRQDEQDLTLRAHIGLIEGSLERIEARQRGEKDVGWRDGSRIGQNPDYRTGGGG